MTRPPDYIVHEVREKNVTVDWFFARGHGRRRLRQLVLMIAGWVFAILPVVITASAITHPRGGGWWSYREGFAMWDITTLLLGFLIGMFIVGFLALHVCDRASAGKRHRRKTYDAERLERRLELAEVMYASKYGDAVFRLERKEVAIEPYEDIETYELRDRYREFGVD